MVQSYEAIGHFVAPLPWGIDICSSFYPNHHVIIGHEPLRVTTKRTPQELGLVHARTCIVRFMSVSFFEVWQEYWEGARHQTPGNGMVIEFATPPPPIGAQNIIAFTFLTYCRQTDRQTDRQTNTHTHTHKCTKKSVLLMKRPSLIWKWGNVESVSVRLHTPTRTHTHTHTHKQTCLTLENTYSVYIYIIS